MARGSEALSVSHRASVKRAFGVGARRPDVELPIPTGVPYISIRMHKTRLSAGLGARTTEGEIPEQDAFVHRCSPSGVCFARVKLVVT